MLTFRESFCLGETELPGTKLPRLTQKKPRKCEQHCSCTDAELLQRSPPREARHRAARPKGNSTNLHMDPAGSS